MVKAEPPDMSTEGFFRLFTQQADKAMRDPDYLDELNRQLAQTLRDEAIITASSSLKVDKSHFDAALRGDTEHFYKTFTGRKEMPKDPVDALQQGYELIRKKESAQFNGTEQHLFGFLRSARSRDDTAELGELLVDYSVQVGRDYATRYAMTMAEKHGGAVSSAILGSSAAKAIAKVAPPAALASGVLACKDATLAYLRDDISGEELLASLSHSVITSTSSLYMGALGQLALPIPIVGAFIGSSVGYFISHIMHQSSLLALGDTAAVAAAKRRRNAVEAMCRTTIPAMRKHRAELERNIDRHFAQRRELILSSFRQMDSALLYWNPDAFASALDQLNQLYGMSLTYKTFGEFDRVMRSDRDIEF
jgi:hypothetical protein